MAGMGFSFTCTAIWDLYQCSISRAEGSLSWHLPATPPGYIRRSEETWRPREELGSSNAQMHLGNPQSFLTTSSQKCNSRKQISNNKVKFSIKLFLLNFPILFTTVMLFAVALLASFYPQRSLRKGKKKNCTKPRMHLLQMVSNSERTGRAFVLSAGVERLWQCWRDGMLKKWTSWFVLRRDRTKWLALISHLWTSWIYPVLHPAVLSGFCLL